jgi:hypothetical protein
MVIKINQKGEKSNLACGTNPLKFPLPCHAEALCMKNGVEKWRWKDV